MQKNGMYGFVSVLETQKIATPWLRIRHNTETEVPTSWKPLLETGSSMLGGDGQ